MGLNDEVLIALEIADYSKDIHILYHLTKMFAI